MLLLLVSEEAVVILRVKPERPELAMNVCSQLASLKLELVRSPS